MKKVHLFVIVMMSLSFLFEACSEPEQSGFDSEGTFANPYLLTLGAPHSGSVKGGEDLSSYSLYSFQSVPGECYVIRVVDRSDNIGIDIFPDTSFLYDYDYGYILFEAYFSNKNEQYTITATGPLTGIGIWSNSGASYIITVSDGVGPVTLATTSDYPMSMAINSTDVFWTGDSSNSIMKISKTTSAPGTGTAIVSDLESYPKYIAADEVNVYWIDDNNIKKMSVNGGTVTTLITGTYDYEILNTIILDDTYVYWCSNYSVGRVAIIDGETTGPIWTETDYIYSITTDTTYIYFTGESYSISVPHGLIGKVALDGGQVTTLVSGLSSPWTIAIKSDNLYFSDWCDILKMSKNGGTVTEIGVTSPQESISLDATNIYWPDSGRGGPTGFLVQNALDGSMMSVLASELYAPSIVAVDEDYVYWIEYWGQTVKKVAIFK